MREISKEYSQLISNFGHLWISIFCFTHVVEIKKKNDAPVVVQHYKTLGHVQKYFKEGVERLPSDGAGEYIGVQVSEHTGTTPNNSQPKSFVERVN